MAKENLLIRQLVATQLLQNRKGHLNISNHVLNSDVTRLQLNQNLTEIPDSPEFKLPSKDFKIQNKSQSLTKTPLLYDRMSYSMDLHPLIKESEIESDQNKEQSIVTPKIKGKPQSTVHRGTHYEYSVMNYFHRLNQDETGVRFSLQCCGGKSDGGVDIWGQLQTADNSKQYRVVVQCKNISRKMSVSTVREFENVLTRLHSDQTEIQNFVLSRNRKKSLLSGVGTNLGWWEFSLVRRISLRPRSSSLRILQCR
ncbi:hypothetical protein MIR68_000222 [Amoeboaphelidium protococcarum]|nr:hypothetical protein MIR68_000222 [Amoeboaphelidium protococcarum]